MIATVIELLQKFPALWAVLGILVTVLIALGGGIITIIVWKKYGPAANEAASELVTLQREAVELQKSTLQMQKDHYEAELKYSREEMDQWKERASTYEKTLHDKRNEWGAEKLEMTALIEQLKSRPDVTSLFEFEKQANAGREAFYKELGLTMKAIHESIEKHDLDAEARIKPMSEALLSLAGDSKKQTTILGMIIRDNRQSRKKVA